MQHSIHSERGPSSEERGLYNCLLGHYRHSCGGIFLNCYFITIRNFSTFFSEQLQSARSFRIHILSSIQLRPRTSETILPCFNSNYHFQILASCKTNQYRESGCCAINSTAAISFPTLWFYYICLYGSLTVLH